MHQPWVRRTRAVGATLTLDGAVVIAATVFPRHWNSSALGGICLSLYTNKESSFLSEPKARIENVCATCGGDNRTTKERKKLVQHRNQNHQATFKRNVVTMATFASSRTKPHRQSRRRWETQNTLPQGRRRHTEPPT